MSAHRQTLAASFHTLATRRLRLVALASPLAVLLALMPLAQAQTFSVIHTFTGGRDGGNPQSGLTQDAAGNLYGTTYAGGYGGYGTVYKMSHSADGWLLTPLYEFQGGYDASHPGARVIFGPDGSLYGTTYSGGGGNCSYYGPGCGTVFKLTPPASACKTAICPWTETILYSAATNNGYSLAGEVAFDHAGNLYATVALGGPLDGGYVFELTPYGGHWTSQILYAFNPDDGDCNDPRSGVIFDRFGNMYGTADTGYNYGAVYELTPSGSGWTEKIVVGFNGSNGDGSEASLVADANGNMYGTTFDLGPNGGGTVFELTPSGGNWLFSLIYGFTYFSNEGSGLLAPVSIGADGNLYGTTFECEYCKGTVFQLAPSTGGWNNNVLYRFTGGDDGGYPYSNVVFDASGNMYGTASYNGAYNGGVVWEITP